MDTVEVDNSINFIFIGKNIYFSFVAP